MIPFSSARPRLLDLQVLVLVPKGALGFLIYHVYTLFLFAVGDLKTILLPLSFFACATAPVQSWQHLTRGVLWILTHQLMCNVSNQARSRAEDALNKPWRPLPSGRITEHQARLLRYLLVVLCACHSALFGADVVLTTLGLVLITYLYDEVEMSSHWFGKNLCNIGGYTMIEIGATKLMGITRNLDRVSAMSVCLSGAVILTTIQAQDFGDTEGDRALGRITFPIYAPELSRVVTLMALLCWSYGLPSFWGIGPTMQTAFMVLGIIVGVRYYFLRQEKADRSSYVLYNVWLTFAHIMPAHARFGAFYL